MEQIKQTCYKGTQILLGNEKRDIINQLVGIVRDEGFEEISIPIIQFQDIFENKVGEHNLHLMFKFEDTKLRKLCLAPEVTAIIQQLSKEHFKYRNNVKVFYVQECFRRENPQAGRYRQFTQFGVEVINPKDLLPNYLSTLAWDLCRGMLGEGLQMNTAVKRGLDYYKNGEGFEINYDGLGAQKQLCGGGEYEGGSGFAIGIDRLILAKGIIK